MSKEWALFWIIPKILDWRVAMRGAWNSNRINPWDTESRGRPLSSEDSRIISQSRPWTNCQSPHENDADCLAADSRIIRNFSARKQRSSDPMMPQAQHHRPPRRTSIHHSSPPTLVPTKRPRTINASESLGANRSSPGDPKSVPRIPANGSTATDTPVHMPSWRRFASVAGIAHAT